MLIPLILFVFTFILTYAVRLVAKKRSLIDIPNERSSHVIPTPRGGGVAIALVWYSYISYLFLTDGIGKELYYPLIAGVFISVISFIDDITDMHSLTRFFIQAVSAFIALYFMGGLEKVDLGFYVIENSYLLNILAFFGILWFINLFNFIDGIDGYAACEAIFVSLILFIFTKNTLVLYFSVIVLGFLPWNWQKARIFMGDVGSTLLGYTLVVLAIHFQNSGEFQILNWLILTSLFWFDATFTLLRRIFNREKFIEGHKKHAYQRLVQSGFSHQKTVLCSLIVNMFMFILVYFNVEQNEFILFGLGIGMILLFIITKIIDKRKSFY